MNQVLQKSESLAINIIDASHKSPNNDDIILKKVKTVLFPDKVTSSVKTETIRIDYYYIEENYISLRVWMII